MKLWEKGIPTDKQTELFTVGNDRELDVQLAEYDVVGSIAHVRMLGKVGLITPEEAAELVNALQSILIDIQNGLFCIEDTFEDIHSKIEYLLTERLGDTGKKIHTGRSRNDQVLVDIHLYLKTELSEIKLLVKELFELLISLAKKNEAILMPGYTHLQVAMPSSFGLWFSAYAESLVDDLVLLDAAIAIADQNPLGSAAGYGTSFAIDRNFTTRELGFSTLRYNPIAAQISRGKTEKTATVAIAAVAGTLSKMAMDICLYLSQNFNFISLPKHLTTGSSIMPHKNNPDIFELIRGKCNKIQALPYELTLISNNLPSGYHRDFQLLKEGLFPAVQTLKSCIEMSFTTVSEIKVRADILDDDMYGHLFTVDAINKLVANDIPFRDAYKIISEQIENGTYVSPKATIHTHEGSINNLCLDEITAKMKKLFKETEN